MKAVKYVTPFKMSDDSDPNLTVGKVYEVDKDYVDETAFMIIDDTGANHSFDRMDYRDPSGFCAGDHFEVVA